MSLTLCSFSGWPDPHRSKLLAVAGTEPQTSDAAFGMHRPEMAVGPLFSPQPQTISGTIGTTGPAGGRAPQPNLSAGKPGNALRAHGGRRVHRSPAPRREDPRGSGVDHDSLTTTRKAEQRANPLGRVGVDGTLDSAIHDP